MPLVKRTKNLWSKARTIDKPYAEVTTPDGWVYRILKAYQTRKAERSNEYARWLCAVRSPMTFGSWDMGDTYLSDVPRTDALGSILEERERAEEAASIGKENT